MEAAPSKNTGVQVTWTIFSSALFIKSFSFAISILWNNTINIKYKSNEDKLTTGPLCINYKKTV